MLFQERILFKDEDEDDEDGEGAWNTREARPTWHMFVGDMGFVFAASMADESPDSSSDQMVTFQRVVHPNLEVGIVDLNLEDDTCSDSPYLLVAFLPFFRRILNCSIISPQPRTVDSNDGFPTNLLYSVEGFLVAAVDVYLVAGSSGFGM
ncbi:uncharacterized protein [Physcomitrium patens]|uniref:uncharacterized protein isoform X3 n=1 Tax=Physcomitrium patens TaxID=3218 RepID=UPI003CCE0DE6